MSFNPFGEPEIKTSESTEMPTFDAFGESKVPETIAGPSFGEFGSFSNNDFPTNTSSKDDFGSFSNSESKDFAPFGSFTENSETESEKFGSFGSFETTKASTEFGSFESSSNVATNSEFKFDSTFSSSNEVTFDSPDASSTTEKQKDKDTVKFQTDFPKFENKDNIEFGSFSHRSFDNISHDAEEFSLNMSNRSVLADALNSADMKEVSEIPKLNFDPIQEKISIPKPIPFKDSPLAKELIDFAKNSLGHEYIFASN